VFRRVLVANRGEIAARVIRTCRRLGIETVLTVSDADVGSLPARLADKVIRIGPAPAADSYLNVDAVVGAALAAEVDAVHPGYGFLSENARLARACAAAGIVFIGPTPETLEAAGDKLAAREHATAAGLPVLPGGRIGPGGHGPALSGPVGHEARMASDSKAAGVTPVGTDEAGGTGGSGGAGIAGVAGLAARIGFPVLVKAAGGGGGRGLRVVREPAELADAVSVASAEAGAAFGDPRVYLERYVERGRHVEVQILGDGERVIHLGDRDCSVQRRYQKLIEEAPAPGLDADLRDRLRAAAVALGMSLGYRGAGTVEFLVDANRGEFYFLEVNARVQVEHPVTEAITGLDIVAEQIAIAEGRPLRLRQEDVRFAGHAIECRINAEDPARDFRPSPGMVSRAVFPVSVGGGRGTRGWRDIGGEKDRREKDRREKDRGEKDRGEKDRGEKDRGERDGRERGSAAGWVRVDTHVQAGAAVPAYYDSLLAKVIACGVDRGEALGTLRYALERCVVEGVVTNLEMQRAVIGSSGFADGGVDTGYLARWLAEGPGDGDGMESAGSVRDDAGVDLDFGAGRGVGDG
jgi:acetyl-CoA carboxylase, biotin carboxylase subunit